MTGQRRRLPVRDARSAGGVVWRPAADGSIELAVGIRASGTVYCLAKGTQEPGEEPIETAVREVQEETGLEVEAGPSLGSTDYWFVFEGVRVHKVVYWWLMRARGGDVANHDREFDAVVWMPAAEALARLSFSDERHLVEQALQQIETASRS